MWRRRDLGRGRSARPTGAACRLGSSAGSAGCMRASSIGGSHAPSINGAECSLRASSRQNWTFLGSDKGGNTAAVLSSLIATAKPHRVDPVAYLREAFERISAHVLAQRLAHGFAGRIRSTLNRTSAALRLQLSRNPRANDLLSAETGGAISSWSAQIRNTPGCCRRCNAAQAIADQPAEK